MVLGDYLYIDGGVTQPTVYSSVITLPVNQTYSLPLLTSWDPSTVQLKRIDKPDDGPVYNRPNLWPAIDNFAFYSFNGDVSRDIPWQKDPPSNPELWMFVPDGIGGGTWRLDRTTAYTNSVLQSTWAACASGNGSVYFLGGWQNFRTTPDYPNAVDEQLSAEGMISYDMVNPTWLNSSITYSYPDGWVWGAQLHYLVDIGKEGLLLAMGGETSRPGSVLDEASLIDYNTVAVYNTVTGEWRNQTTTGDVPAGRGAACSVGVRGDNGTFEVRFTFLTNAPCNRMQPLMAVPGVPVRWPNWCIPHYTIAGQP